MTEALARAKPRIDDPEGLARVVRRLVEAFAPAAIYLFGSRARGDASDESDYDLMLVLADDADRVQGLPAVWKIAKSDRIDVNPFVTRAEAFAWRRHEVGTLEYEVQIDGVRLHPSEGLDPRSFTGPRSRTAMTANIVGEWLRQVGDDLAAAKSCNRGEFAVPSRAAYHVQQAAEKLTKAALVAHATRPRKGHKIAEFARRLPDNFELRPRFLQLDQFSDYVWAHRYPRAPGQVVIPLPDAAAVDGWIDQIQALEADFERWLAERQVGS